LANKLIPILLFFALLISLLGVGAEPAVAASSPVVRAVLFFSPTCGHCEKVIQEDLPPLQARYGEQLLIARINVTEPAGQALYQATVTRFNVPDERLGVPTLVVGQEYLVGSVEIPERFPEMIEKNLANGLAWPDLPGLEPFIQGLEKTEPAQSDTEPASGLQRMGQRFLVDPLGNSLAVAVLLGMLISLVAVGYSFVMGDVQAVRFWPAWVIPLLSVIGMGVAIYLTFVETTQTTAICGPIGDCNSVQKSPYATLFGFLPVGLLGLIGYIGILGLWLLQFRLSEANRRLAWLALFGLAIFGLLFSIYLTFLEPFVIGATCIWCISSAIVMTLLVWAILPHARQAASPADEED
jgi:uncharacterized membrane protein